MFENFYSDGWLPNGVLPIFSTLLTVVFAFSGTEVVGVAAGELGLTRRMLGLRMERYGISYKTYRTGTPRPPNR